jgi:hypothetical protein
VRTIAPHNGSSPNPADHFYQGDSDVLFDALIALLPKARYMEYLDATFHKSKLGEIIRAEVGAKAVLHFLEKSPVETVYPQRNAVRERQPHGRLHARFAAARFSTTLHEVVPPLSMMLS